MFSTQEFHQRKIILRIELVVMNMERYDFVKIPESIYYKFYSKGPKGYIKKVVEFYTLRRDIYNLSFGDWRFAQEIDDMVVTNNNDRDKVLCTVAGVVEAFMTERPKSIVFAEGSTQSRNRLYRIGISKFLNKITHHFDIRGLTEQGWESFQKNTHYSGFMLKPKVE
jgi:hypothetical protein